LFIVPDEVPPNPPLQRTSAALEQVPHLDRAVAQKRDVKVGPPGAQRQDIVGHPHAQRLRVAVRHRTVADRMQRLALCVVNGHGAAVRHPVHAGDGSLGGILPRSPHRALTRLLHGYRHAVERDADAVRLVWHLKRLDELMLHLLVLPHVLRADGVSDTLEARTRVREAAQLVGRCLRLPRRPLLEQVRHPARRARQPHLLDHSDAQTDRVDGPRVALSGRPVKRSGHHHPTGLRHVGRLVLAHPCMKHSVEENLRRIDDQRRQRRLMRATLDRRDLLPEPPLERLVAHGPTRAPALHLRPRLGHHRLQRRHHPLEHIRNLQHHRRHGASSWVVVWRL
jgi:hypothetical protein